MMTQKQIELSKRSFECELENTYGIENQNSMNRIHDHKVKNTAK